MVLFPMQKVTIHVPATTANLGPGYDCLGLALDFGNRMQVARGDEGVLAEGEAQPLVAEAARLFFAMAGVEPFSFSWEIEGEVPIARGLGSSVTVRLGALMGLNVLAGEPLEKTELFALCSELEGHPDNTAPALWGGFTVCTPGLDPVRFSVDEGLAVVLWIPCHALSTGESRAVLPEQISHFCAAENVARTARIVAAMASGEYGWLAGSLQDHLHQPYRARMIARMEERLQRGVQAGAWGGFLSGSGSTLGWFSPPDAAEAVAGVLREGEVEAEVRVVGVDNEGARVV